MYTTYGNFCVNKEFLNQFKLKFHCVNCSLYAEVSLYKYLMLTILFYYWKILKIELKYDFQSLAFRKMTCTYLIFILLIELH